MEKEKKWRKIPIIVITSEPSSTIKETINISQDIDAYLSKPVKLSEILQTICKVYKQYKSNGVKILIVDDEKVASKCLQNILARSGEFNILLCHTLAHAKQTILEHIVSLDFVLLDSELPDGSGRDLVEFLEELNHNHRGFKNQIKFISVSGHDIERQKELYSGFTIYGYLQKPVRKHELFGLLSIQY